MQNILFFGDSLTAGYGLRSPATESFPALIEQKINAAKLDCRVVNAGLSGDTSAGGLNRADYWLGGVVNVFVLELGVNDIIRGVAPQTTLNNLQAIINKVKAKNPQAKLALMGMEIPPFIPGPFATQFRDIYSKLADANKMAFVPFFLEGIAGIGRFNLPDRIHPTAEGYKIIADKVWPVIEKLLINNPES
ncbi:MAG TPA: arylesterase [Mucilaginibacter sp.]|jgi:acyl-CoA thioesterase-1